MQTKQEGISPREMMKTEQAIYKARGLAFRHLDGDRLGVFVAFNGEKKGFDAILHNDAEAEAFRDGLRLGGKS